MTKKLEDLVKEVEDARKAIEAQLPKTSLGSVTEALIKTMKAVEEMAKKK